MLQFSVLASGSRANCLFVEGGGSRVLVDCGLSARQAALRLGRRGIDPDSIDAIVVSHEHSDHINGVRVFAKRHKTRVLTNAATLERSRELQALDPSQVELFAAGSSFTAGGMVFDPFSVVHDAADPVGFRIRCGEVHLGVVTDLGQLTALVRQRVQRLRALVIEANHDPLMLQEAPYPWELKQRIGSRRGHLSNCMAGELLAELCEAESSGSGDGLELVIAAHISENSNTPELALEELRSGWRRGGSAAEPGLYAASPAEASELFRLR